MPGPQRHVQFASTNPSPSPPQQLPGEAHKTTFNDTKDSTQVIEGATDALAPPRVDP